MPSARGSEIDLFFKQHKHTDKAVSVTSIFNNFLWPNVKTKKKHTFFTNFLIGAQIIGKRKNYIENGGGLCDKTEMS